MIDYEMCLTAVKVCPKHDKHLFHTPTINYVPKAILDKRIYINALLHDRLTSHYVDDSIIETLFQEELLEPASADH